MTSYFPQDSFASDDLRVRQHVHAVWTALVERSANRITSEECEQLFGSYLLGLVETRHEQEDSLRRLIVFRALAEMVMPPTHVERVLHFVPDEQPTTLTGAFQSIEQRGRADGTAFAAGIRGAAGAAAQGNRNEGIAAS
jgi:NADH:ubiquinone oxidoreductase subunit